MSSIRKLERAEQSAYERLTSARADLIAAQLERDGTALLTNTASTAVAALEDANVARLKRRVGAYTVQWEAVQRKLEAAVSSREGAL